MNYLCNLHHVSYLPTVIFLCLPVWSCAAKDTTHVRVLLHKSDNTVKRAWQFTSKNGFVVEQSNIKKRSALYAGDTLTVRAMGTAWRVQNKKKSCAYLVIKPRNGTIAFGGREYVGSIWLMRHKGNILLINSVPLEAYVCSVLRTESWPGWPKEVNKAFAITSRTYVIATALSARKAKRPYDVKNTNEHQTYSGTHSSVSIKQAVAETRGVLLTHEGKPIVAMFDSCCGGVVPAHMQEVNFADAPYLARTYPCEHCKRCKIFSWQGSYALHELDQFLHPYLPKQGWLKKLTVSKVDKAGVVQEVVAHGKKQTVTLDGKKLYAKLKKVKSFCFTIRHEENKIVFDGRGFGHHLGLCQWGAREMVRDGWNYKKILKFYYPGTQFMRLS